MDSLRATMNRLDDFLHFKEGHLKTVLSDDLDGGNGDDQETSEGEKTLRELINLSEEFKSTSGQLWTVDDIQKVVTAKHLCSCKDPIKIAFEVNCKLRRLADTCTENTEALNKLANQAEDFAVQLIDQVNAKEELVIRDVPEIIDRYASMLSGMTDDAIMHSQKKFVAHPLLYKRLKMRWNLGLPESLKPHGKFRALLFLCFLILIDTALTPILLPFIGYGFYRDQKKRRELMIDIKRRSEKIHMTDEADIRFKAREDDSDPLLLKQNNLDKYIAYFTTPFVIFVKDKISQLVFIMFHCRVCVSASSVEPTTEEYFIFVFFAGLILSESQQYKRSPHKYFKDMWNYLDVAVLVIYVVIVFLRILTMFRGGDPYENRLLEVSHCLYGVNTMFLVMRFSSILELSSVVGPLQLALFRMLVDLLVILIQFVFVIVAFSVAITKTYTAEMSFLAPANNKTVDLVTEYKLYCKEGALDCLWKTFMQLVWSVFGLTDLQEMDSHSSFTSQTVAIFYLLFLVLTVIMLVNMLVALLTNTYDNVTTNAEIEWKFSRAVIENQYRNLHSIIVPFNLLTVLLETFYFMKKGDSREEHAENRRNEYKIYYRKRLFPFITKRYLKRYGGSFPMSVEEKMDLIMEKFKILHCDEEEQVEERIPVYITYV